ncbi:hypothetical protein niasHT_011306 [Heterodera trifolii]|uniref:Uncharacterized protein n=1 Tax=Heterodera trifolii TaxID=157864 RepID=A0ABD2L9W5_9BILA
MQRISQRDAEARRAFEAQQQRKGACLQGGNCAPSSRSSEFETADYGSGRGGGRPSGRCLEEMLRRRRIISILFKFTSPVGGGGQLTDD